MNKIESFQELLKLNKITAYIIPTSDFHLSEYVSDHFKAREYLSGFTGSAGTLVVTNKEARLWTDGRYFLQAERELASSGITLMRSGQAGVPTIVDYLNSIINENDILAFDGRVVSTNDYLMYQELTKAKLKVDIDLVSEIWEGRCPLPSGMLYELSEFYAGETSDSKIQRLRDKISEQKADTLVLSALEDQAWLYNLRGEDVTHTPVFLSFSVITLDSIYLFIDSNKLNQNVKNIINDLDIKVRPYDEIYSFLKSLSGKTVILDKSKTNSLVYLSLYNNKLVFTENPTSILKAIKNETEIKNTKLAHILDGVAVTRLMYFLKTQIGKIDMSEISVSNYLEELRRNNESLIDLSFNTICAYKEHAAMMHYSATNETNYKIKNEGMLLIDSGGHYLEGTTDITRTFSMGNPTIEEKKYFTTVLSSVINLADTIFLKGQNGMNLDIMAREPIWKLLIDYKCGTGHGVGHILSVHEGPNSFRYSNAKTAFKPGMITTDEPGIYLENKLGIRIENELLCKEIETNEWGTFYGFETITYAPIDLDLVDKELLTKRQIEWLNEYHNNVYEKLESYLNDEEKVWLKQYTKAI